MENSDEAAREIVVSRLINGPRDLVYAAYTELRHLSQWFGPRGFTTTTHLFEFRPGGAWEYTMHGPDGTDYPNYIEYIEISPPERIVLLHGAHRDDPEAFTSTVTFAERGGGCEVTLRSLFRTKEQRDHVVEHYHAIEGAEQTLAGLAGYIERNQRSTR
jgi:uncharacterized protein YndB with AHSA1/START domain